MSKFTKLLIVDDEPQNFEVIKEILKIYPNYVFYSATSGERALELLEKYHPDIILLDILLPGISGLELCRRIRNDGNNQFAKIILISGLAKIGDKLKGYEAGADDYIIKPFVEDELIAKLKVYSKLSRMEEVERFKTTALNLLSHETRTPLNGIILGSELLTDLPDLTSEAKRYANMVRISAIRIQELVDKISKYCTLKDGIQLSAAKGNLYDKLQVSTKKLRKLNNIPLNLNFDKSIEFHADWSILMTGMVYLLEYALKKSRENGLVVVECKKNDKQISLSINYQADELNGDEDEKIFDGLFIPDVLHHQEGSGLGLAIAKEIVEAHWGKIRVVTSEARESTFRMDLKDLNPA